MTDVSSMEVTFTAPMPGLESSNAFTLRGVDGAPALFALEASAGLAVRLFVADAAVYVPGYAPDLPSSAVEAGQTTTLLVVTPGPGEPTVNLAAPIVLNPGTGLCTQLVLDGKNYPLRAPLAADRTESAG
ncbi:Flagellar assembly protein FliW [Arthrobacter sp. 9AX]|uniref:flagellar assembly protein FliW n=1 Tax=Arthrobacter sp. 9AX TaxID=2653131 RepID=UPI0012F031BC|nr:flagellar assembly protein FliW [Arthrobacter sp. 9AX]VXB81451.1 Flagellar assembly protein FliW [Arthrobacter sp. 9AX]